MAEYPTLSETRLFYHYKNILGIPFQKKIIFAVILVFIFFITYVCAFTLLRHKKVKTDKQNSEIASFVTIQNSVNIFADPCVNFYEFSCGLWSGSNLIPEDNPRVTTFSILQKNIDTKLKTIFETTNVSSSQPRIVNDAVRFYEVCVNIDSNDDGDLALILSYLRQMGGWPILDGKAWDESSFHWARAGIYLEKTLHIHPVFSVSSIIDDNNATRKIIYLRKPSLLKDDDARLTNIVVFQMLCTILATLSHADLNVREIYAEMSQMNETEVMWEKMLSFTSKSEIKLTFKELNEKIPEFDFLKHVQSVMNDTLNELNQVITEDDDVVVEDILYLKNAIDVLQSSTFTKRKLANLFGWFVVKDIYILIPGVLHNYAVDKGFNLQDVKEVCERKCFELVKDIYESSLDYLFVKNFKQNNGMVGIVDSLILIGYVKKSFRDMIEKSVWFDSDTKNAAILKLDNMQDIVVQNYLDNKTAFDNMYALFPAVSSSPLGTYLNIKAYFVSMMILELNVPADNKNWILPRSVTDVSAYYAIQRNALVFPLSLHNPPFYFTKGPWYLNFGAIGSIIGHEMMHGFDNKGCRRGQDGSLENWWTNSSLEIYEAHSQCFKDQYDHYKGNSFNATPSGLRTLDENIADSEGLKIAYLAYKQREKEYGMEEQCLLSEKFTPDQMFFIAFGSVWCSKISPSMQVILSKGSHSFPEFRVNGAISNNEYFSKAFQCPVGSPMNPKKKCSIW